MNKLVFSVIVTIVVLSSTLFEQTNSARVLFKKPSNETSKTTQGTLFIPDIEANKCPDGHKRDHRGKCRLIVMLDYDDDDE